MACPVTKTLSIAFTPSASATSYRVKWRIVGTSSWTTPAGVFTSSPIAIPNVPVCENVEGTVEAVCGATYSTVATFLVNHDTMYSCNDSVSGTSSSTVYMRYPKKVYDLNLAGDLITVTYDVTSVPNRINVYNSAGSLVANSGWKGVANYSGPWGTSLNTSTSGTFTFLKSTSGGDGRYYYIETEHAGSSTSDSWTASMTCTITSNGGGSGNPTYSVSPNTLTVQEGGSVTWTVTTTNVANGTTLYYSLTGSANAADFTDSTLTGSFIVSNGTGTFSKTLRNDVTTEGNETIIAAVKTVSVIGTTVATAASVSISDTSTASNYLDPTYTITPSSSSVIEGNQITFNIITTNVNSNTTLYYTIQSLTGNMTSADFTDNSLNGSITIQNNAAQFTKTLTDDGYAESGNTFKVVLRSGSITGIPVAETTAVTVLDASQAVNPPTYQVVPSVTSVNEGSSVTWTVTTTGLDDGTVLYYTIDGGVGNNDMTTVTNGQLTINGNTGTFSRTFVNDQLTEGNETVIARLRSGSISGTVIATSATVTLVDTSQTPVVVTFYSASRCDDNHSDIVKYNGADTIAIGTVVKSTDDFCYTITGVTSDPGFAPSGGMYVSSFSDCNACTGYTAPTPTYSVSKNTSSLNEGGTVTITVNTTNVPDGTVLYHQLAPGSNVVDLDFTDETTQGSFTINNNTGSFTRTLATDLTTEGNETFSINIKTVSLSGSIVGNSGTITVVDSSTTPQIVTYYNVTACAGGSGVLRYDGPDNLALGLVVVSDNGNCYTIGTTTSGPASSGIYSYEVSDCNDSACS